MRRRRDALEVVVRDDGDRRRADRRGHRPARAQRPARRARGRADARQPARRGHPPLRADPDARGVEGLRRLLAALALALVAALAGCGGTTTVREPDLVVRGDDAVPARPSPAPTPERGRGLRVAAARIAVVSHGQASDPFWSIVKKGVDDAARQTGVAVSYRAPDNYSIDRMRRLIDEAIADRLDGLVVSLPDVAGAARRDPARRARRHPGRVDQLRQRPLPRARDPRPRRPAGVARRGSRAGERMASGGRPQRAVRQPGGRQRRASTCAAAASARAMRRCRRAARG